MYGAAQAAPLQSKVKIGVFPQAVKAGHIPTSYAAPEGASLPRDVRADALLSDFFAPIFERLFYYDHELVGDGAVEDAVVVAQS